MEEFRLIARLIEGKIPQDWASSPLEQAFNERYGELEDMENEWGADHYQLFGMEVFPFASVFLSLEAQMGAEPSEWAAEIYRRGEWYPKAQPDQACAMLRFLIHAMEIDEELAEEFLSRHMLSWFPVFCQALINQEHPFFEIMAKRLLELLGDLVKRLDPEPFEVALEPLDAEFLDEPEHGLKDIAKALTTPCQSGIYFSRVDQMQIAHHLRLPANFATRSQVMPSLFYSSVDYHKQKELIQALVDFATDWKQQLQAMPFQAWLDPWYEAIDGTLEMLPLIKVQD